MESPAIKRSGNLLSIDREGKSLDLYQQSSQVAIIQWAEPDGIAEAIHHELAELGYSPTFFPPDSGIPANHDIVFTFAPYGKFIPLVRQLEMMPVERRPILVHWNTEGLPDLRLPWFLARTIAAGRSWLDRVTYDMERRLGQANGTHTLLPMLNSRILRFRYLGDYYYAYGKGVLNILSDSSALYTQIRNRNGLPTVFAPWGSSPKWYADLRLERDIDVLWMGNRKGRRRRMIIDRVRDELRRHGVEVYMADDEENPFIYQDERTHFLNRAKITLNITRTWYDDNFSRFAYAAPNRSMIISETMLPHCPAYKPGVHYVECAPKDLARTILYYLQHPEERTPIVENAYRLLTSTLTLNNSITTIMQAAERVRQQRSAT